jgi:hypothetical protein
VNDNKGSGLPRKVAAFRERFAQTVESTLGEVLSPKRLEELVTAEVGSWRKSVFSPIQTVLMFLEQVLNADQSCRDAVSRERSARVARDEPACSSNNGPYCTARKRLPLGLLARIGQEIGTYLVKKEPLEWRWRGRPVK